MRDFATIGEIPAFAGMTIKMRDFATIGEIPAFAGMTIKMRDSLQLVKFLHSQE
jgi:hypothetical protein